MHPDFRHVKMWKKCILETKQHGIYFINRKHSLKALILVAFNCVLSDTDTTIPAFFLIALRDVYFLVFHFQTFVLLLFYGY